MAKGTTFQGDLSLTRIKSQECPFPTRRPRRPIRRRRPMNASRQVPP
jgi:hypothetical protein